LQYDFFSFIDLRKLQGMERQSMSLQATTSFNAAEPDLIQGVRTRRIFAFLVDAVAILLISVLGYLFITVLGILTLGLGLLLLGLVFPVVALSYTAFTLGGPKSATPGMQLTGLEMRFMHDGSKMTPLLACGHVLLFWFGTGIFWPAVVITSLFSSSKRCLHDMLLGTVVINTQASTIN
jgi:uncharacterized RDD family membrane protein YckC